MTPLADRMRPKTLAEYIGQKHLLGEGKLLRRAIEQKQLFSMILWGPPGVGKTTIARIIAKESEHDFLEFSAVTTGIAEIKKIIGEYGTTPRLFIPVVFVDEIHRFNKAQQDAFLPLVENGKIILIGATTENPSFEVIGPLLSRARVFVLQQLSVEELREVVTRALADSVHGLGEYRVQLDEDAVNFLIEGSNGDARRLLNTLEVAVMLASETNGESVHLNRELVEEAMQRKSLGYDKGGEEHYNTISAFIKSMRASNVDAALYYLARMMEAGEDALFIARRMVIFASEDIGMAQPTALVVANEVFRACETIGYPECQINLGHGVVYLASSPKDRRAYDALRAAQEDVRETGNLPIPMNLRNAPTKLMKEIGYGKGYEMYSSEDLLPEKLKGKNYY
ncbi:MAG: replication-associated recombination protein A [bacterium]|nr:replication-associated recombination protein A [bacterium]